MENPATIPNVEIDTTSLSNAMSHETKGCGAYKIKAKKWEFRRHGFEERGREEEVRGKMSGIDKPKFQIKQASGWPNGLVGGQTYDLGWNH